MSNLIYSVAGITTLSIGVTIFFYNRLARSKVKVKEAWSGIKVQLKKRRDLVERLEGVVKSSTNHDQQLLRELTRTRYDSEVARTVNLQASAEEAFTATLHQILDSPEAFAGLTADDNFKKLRDAIEKTEDDIGLARRYYNAVVRDHNNKCVTFPSSFFANIMKMGQFDFFSEDES